MFPPRRTAVEVSTLHLSGAFTIPVNGTGHTPDINAVDDILSYSILRMFTTSTQLCSIGLIVCIVILLVFRYAYMSRESFTPASEESRYEAIRIKLKKDMAPYCQMTKFAHDYMKKLFTMKSSPADMAKPTKPIPDDYGPEQKAAALSARASAADKAATVGPPGDTPQQAEKRILEVYRKVYTCKDDMASSRPSCKRPAGPDDSKEFIPCSTYLELPVWDKDDTLTMSAALMKIPRDLPVLLTRELDWFEAMTTQLKKATDMAESPPDSPPDSELSGKSYAADGFLDKGTCSPSEIQARLALLRKRKKDGEVSNCVIPPIGDQLTRIESILGSVELKAVLDRCGPMLKKMTSLKATMDKLENGLEFSMPKKNYLQFPGGDRANALVFSIKQNQP